MKSHPNKFHVSLPPSALISALASTSASAGTFDKKNSSFPLVAIRAFIVNSRASALSFFGAPVLESAAEGCVREGTKEKPRDGGGREAEDWGRISSGMREDGKVSR